jgi:hypothetical protein
MENSTWEGWTTPQPPPSVPLGYPEGRMLPTGAPAGWVGEIRSLPKATDDTIKFATRMWPQGRPEDFERDGRRYVERSTGVEYHLVHGNPLFGDDPEAADLFLSEDGSLWFLRRNDRPEARSQWMGTMGPVKA